MDINEKISYKLTNAGKSPVVLPGHGGWDNDKRKHEFESITLGCKLDENVAGNKPWSVTIPGAQMKSLLKIRAVRALVASQLLTVSTGQNLSIGI